MKIDVSKMRHFWWEDEQGNVLQLENDRMPTEQAIWVYANSCERCMNVLLHKYLNGADGYPEYSEEWKKCNTICDFCRARPTEKGGEE